MEDTVRRDSFEPAVHVGLGRRRHGFPRGPGERASRYADCNRIRGHVAEHDRVCTDDDVVADRYRAEHLRPRVDHDALADDRNAGTLGVVECADRHAVIQYAILANDRARSDDEPHPVENRRPGRQPRAPVDIDTVENLHDSRQHLTDDRDPGGPEPVREPVRDERLEATIVEPLEQGAVALNLEIAPNLAPDGHSWAPFEKRCKTANPGSGVKSFRITCVCAKKLSAGPPL